MICGRLCEEIEESYYFDRALEISLVREMTTLMSHMPEQPLPAGKQVTARVELEVA